MDSNLSASESRSEVHDRVCTVMQVLLRGVQARLTDDQLSAASGVPARTIKSYRVEGKEPSLGNALSLLAALGPQAVNAVLSVVGYAGARHMDDVEDLNPRQIVADLLAPIAVIAAASADGRIDHLKMPSCRDAADQIIATIIPLSNAAAVLLKD